MYRTGMAGGPEDALAALAVGVLFFLWSAAYTTSVVSHFRRPRRVPPDVLRLVEPVFASGAMRWVGLAFVSVMAVGGQVAIVVLLLSVPLTWPEAAFLAAELLMSLAWAVVVWRNSDPLPSGNATH